MLEDKIEQWYQKRGRKIVFFLCTLVIVYLIVKLRILGLFAPFIVAWIFASLLNYFVTWTNTRFNLPRGIGTILSMLTILSGLLGIAYMICKKLWEQVVAIASNLPKLTDDLMLQAGEIEQRFSVLFNKWPAANALSDLDSAIEKVMNSLSTYLGSAIPVVYNALSALPDLIVFIVAMLVATFFMTKDFYIIKGFVKAQFSDTIVDKVVIMQRGILHAIGGYVRTQLILMSITFSICLVGLCLFRLSYALLLSVVIAIVDAFPVLGSGTILIPWAVYNLIAGNYSLAIGLLCIYGIIFMARQIFEPRILSAQIGVYALVTIMFVYIGYKTLGFAGLIVGPAVAVILKMLQNVGALPAFKPIKEMNQRGEKDEKHTCK